MAKCCFLSAEEARKQARNTTVILTEINAIESTILANVNNGVFFANVSSGTTMTDSNAYYAAYNDISSNVALKDQIECVEEHFECQGYSVFVGENAQTGNTITWNIAW